MATVVDDILDIHKYLMKRRWHSVIKMFEFVKKCFFTGPALLSILTSVYSLSCTSMNNQECKVRPEIVNINSDDPVFSLLVLKQVNAVVVVIISMTHMQKCVFPML